MPPRPKIPAHVFFYAVASIPGIGYAMYWRKNHSTDEEFEEMLRKNYGSKIESSRSKKEGMIDIIGGLKSRDPTQESKFAEVLHGGKSGQAAKRHHPVDETLYGTKEGVERKALFEKEEEEARRRKKRKKRKKKRKEEEGERSLEALSEVGNGEKTDRKKKRKKKRKKEDALVNSKHTTALVVLGGLALVASMLISRRK